MTLRTKQANDTLEGIESRANPSVNIFSRDGHSLSEGKESDIIWSIKEIDNISRSGPKGLGRSDTSLDAPGSPMGRPRDFGMERPQSPSLYQPLYSRQLKTNASPTPTVENYNNFLVESEQGFETFPTGDLDRAASSSPPIELKNNAYEQAQLLLVSLLENFCALYDRNPDKNRRLFIALCKQLWNMGILTSADFFNRSEELRGVYKEAFRTLVLQAIQGIEADTEGELRLLPSQDGDYSSEDEGSASGVSTALSRGEAAPSSYGSAFEIKPVQSRLESEFKYLEIIGRGGFAQVLRGEHRIDHCLYAFKRIEFKSKDSESYEKIIREIKSLAHLDHPYIVRYHGAWIESKTQVGNTAKRRPNLAQSREALSINIDESLLSNSSVGITVPIGNSATDFEVEISPGYFMIIQMELCQFTLSDWIEQRNFLIKHGKPWKSEHSHHKHFTARTTIPSDRMSILAGDQKWDINPVENCRIFKCIVKAIQHIHAKGIIHRDLKPGNILFQVDGDMYIPKVGDFGLASDLSLGSLGSPSGPYVMGSSYDENSRRCPLDTPKNLNFSTASPSPTSRSTRTTGLGTCMYAAPEQIRDTNYDEKVDIYSLGIILFELFYPFATRMERQDILEDLKNGILPAPFVKRWPKEATLVWSCISQNAETRPTAQQILESEILEQDPDDTIERLIKENSTLKMLLEIERDRVRALEQDLRSLVGQTSDNTGSPLVDELFHMSIRQS